MCETYARCPTTLSVTLANVGGGIGTFINTTPHAVRHFTYDWTILYNPNSDFLHLDNIVLTPGSVAMLGQRHFRPADVDFLFGDPAKAKKKRG